MTKYIRMNEIILPDMESMLIRCGFASSRADLMLKIMRIKDPKLTGDKKIFRIFRKGNESLLNYENKQYLKKEFKKLIGTERKEIMPNLLDIRTPGYWAQYQGFFLGYKSPVSRYVLKLCEHEKKTLLKIHKPKESMKPDEHIILEIKTWLRLSDHMLVKLTNGCYVNDEDLGRMKGVLHAHRFINLAAIMEFDMKRSISGYPNDGIIKQLLPSIGKDRNVESSISKLMKLLYTSVGYSSQEKFVDDLCREGMEADSVKKRLNRWKSGKNSIDVKKFMNLFFSKNSTKLSEYYFPEEILYICIILDQVLKDCLSLGLSANEVVNEFHCYEEYENINFDIE